MTNIEVAAYDLRNYETLNLLAYNIIVGGGASKMHHICVHGQNTFAHCCFE
jgi:hypothetical protein